jgi:hypothetical protein
MVTAARAISAAIQTVLDRILAQLIAEEPLQQVTGGHCFFFLIALREGNCQQHTEGPSRIDVTKITLNPITSVFHNYSVLA